MNASPEPSEVEMPPITKEKKAHVDRVMKDQARVDLARQYFPANIEPTEWLHVDAVVAGFGYNDYESCNGVVIARHKPFYKKYSEFLSDEKWYRRNGAKSYYSRQLIEAYSDYRVSTFPGKPIGKPFDWGAALAVSPIVSVAPPIKPPRGSRALVRRPPPAPPLADPWDDAIDVATKPVTGIDPSIAPTLAEFAQAVGDGKLPAPDVEFMGIPLYRAATLSRFKTGGKEPKDFTTNFADADSRVDLPVDMKSMSVGIPPELSALTEYSGVEFYRVEGATDHRLAIGIKAGGRSTDPTTLRHALAQDGFIMKPPEKHLVTAWLALDYLGEARDNKALASQIKGIKDRGLERQLNSEAQRLEDPAVGNDGIKAALPPQFDMETRQALIDQAEYSRQIALNTSPPIINSPYIHEYSSLAVPIDRINDIVLSANIGLPAMFRADGKPIWRVWDGSRVKGSRPVFYLILTNLGRGKDWIELFSLGQSGPNQSRISSSHERIKMLTERHYPVRVLYYFLTDKTCKNTGTREEKEGWLQSSLKTVWEGQFDEDDKEEFRNHDGLF